MQQRQLEAGMEQHALTDLVVPGEELEIGYIASREPAPAQCRQTLAMQVVPAGDLIPAPTAPPAQRMTDIAEDRRHGGAPTRRAVARRDGDVDRLDPRHS